MNRLFNSITLTETQKNALFAFGEKDKIGTGANLIIAACMCEGQREAAVDMMMYYSLAPTTMNGIFDFYTCKPIYGYWAIYGFADLCELGTNVSAESDDPDLYVTAARDDEGRGAIMLSYYTAEEGREDKAVTVTMDGLAVGTAEVYTADAKHSYEVTDRQSGNIVTLTMKPNSMIVVKTDK